MKPLFNFLLTTSLVFITAVSVRAEDDEGSSSTTYHPDGGVTETYIAPTDDGFTSGSSHIDKDGNESLIGITSRANSATIDHRENTNNAGFDINSKILPDEVDENDENITGRAVFFPNGSSASSTEVRRQDGGLDKRVEINAADGDTVLGVGNNAAQFLKSGR